MIFILLTALFSSCWAKTDLVSQIEASMKSPFSYTNSRSIASTETIPAEKKWLAGCVLGASTYLNLNRISLKEGWTVPMLAKAVCEESMGQLINLEPAALRAPYHNGCGSGVGKLIRTFEGLEKSATLLADKQALIKAVQKYCEG